MTPLSIDTAGESSYGALVWLRQPNFGLSEKDFINAAFSQISMRYEQYLRERQPEDSGAETPPAGVPDRTAAQQLEAGNALLARATMGKTRLVRIQNGDERQRREAREAGFSCLEAELDRSGTGLRDGAQAESLLRQVSAQRGDVRVWLGDAAGAAGLRAFLTAAAAAENRCLALTETLP